MQADDTIFITKMEVYSPPIIAKEKTSLFSWLLSIFSHREGEKDLDGNGSGNPNERG